MSYRPSHRQLQYFLAVAERGHFADAAKACHVTQPTLSTQLKLLEEQLGVVLIDRGGGTAKATPMGERLLPLVRTVFSALDEVVELARTGADNLGGLIRLGVAPTFGPYFMPHLLPILHARYPSLEIYIREDRPAALEASLAAGVVDCILSPLPLAGDRFDMAPLCDEKIFLGLPGKHPLALAETVPAAMLAGEKLLTLGRGHRLFDQVQQLCEVSGAKMREDYEGTSLDALRQMVSIGMGLSLFPAAYVSSEFRKETAIKLAEIAGWPIKRTICLAWRRDSVRRAHFHALAQEAASVAAELKIEGIEAARLM